MEPRKQSASGKSLSPTMKPLGILGGGQLARMMALKAHSLGIPIAVLSESENDPAAQVASLWVQGKLDDSKSLLRFISRCSTVTFESEFLDAELLEKLAKQSKVPIFPRPRHMALVQDRLTQKKLLEKNDLPTSPFIAVFNEAHAKAAFRKFDGHLVFKKRRFGYDGYGTFVVRTPAQFERFLTELNLDSHGFIAERFVSFEREIAVMVARGLGGTTLHLPFVETHQVDSRCLWARGPVGEKGKLKKLAQKLESFLTSFGYVGIMGVELFDTGHGFLINELAPRVHNSGHYSMDALSDDQFSIHIKAVLGLPIATPQTLAPGFAMMNLLGQSNRSPSWTLRPDVHLHWYGKTQNRKGRKMGHINATAATAEKALDLVIRRREDFRV